VAVQEIERAVAAFHRDGVVAIENVLTPHQLSLAREGADRVIRMQTEARTLRGVDPRRGQGRHSFGWQHHHPEWVQLIELPRLLELVKSIFRSADFRCLGGGGDYALPGAAIQPLHSDMHECIRDPQERVRINDLPTPFVNINFPLIDFTPLNGATRYVLGTHRTRAVPPTLEQEPTWMRQSVLCLAAGGAILRDTRCWHGGTPNQTAEVRTMLEMAYTAPWFRYPGVAEAVLPAAVYEGLSEVGRRLCRDLRPG
jgi:hypothetical protein